MHIRDYMSQPVLVAAPQDGARETFFRMREAQVHHLPILEGAKLVGVLSDRDLRRPDWVDEAPDLSHPYELNDGMTVGDLMTRHPITVHVYDSMNKAAELILEHGFGALPVLDRGDHLVGVLTKLDLVRALHTLLSRHFE